MFDILLDAAHGARSWRFRYNGQTGIGFAMNRLTEVES